MNVFDEIPHRENQDGFSYQHLKQPIILYLNHKISSLEAENQELKKESLFNSSKNNKVL